MPEFHPAVSNAIFALGSKPKVGTFARPTYLSTNIPDYVTYTNGVMYCTPLVVVASGTIDRIGVRLGTVSGSTGSVIRLGIYDDNGNVYPNTLLIDGGTVSGEAVNADVQVTVNVSIAAGVYWLAVAQQGAPTTASQISRVRASNGYLTPIPVQFTSSTTAASSQGSGVLAFSQTGVTGALPSTFTTTRTEVTSGNPIVFVRWA